jgi:PAT family beta-lactamase induction signal transducer AmpG
MGLAIAPLGCYFGFISTAMGILLRARGVSVERIDYMSAVAFSPTFWAFLLCPVLDVRFSKRVYAVFFAAVGAICLGGATLLIRSLPAFTAVLTIGCTAIVIFGNAHQGWMPDVISDQHYSHVGATSNVANIGMAGAFATWTVFIVRHLPPVSAAVLLTSTSAAPAALLFFIPLPALPARGIAEVFASFFRDLYAVCRRRDCIIGLICFAAPTACFALTNSFSSLGSDFHATETQVTAINGTGVAVICSMGCLIGVWFCNRFLKRNVYIAMGFFSAAVALLLLMTPHALGWYTFGVLVYNLFQGINYTAFSSFCYEIVGPKNPLAATQISVLAAAANLPISYMTAIEGHAHTAFGLSGMLAADAVSTLVVGTTLALVLRYARFGSGSKTAPRLAGQR